MISFVLNMSSHIKDENDGEKGGESDKNTYRVLNRDTGKRIIGKALDAACIFIYQAAVFQAQWALVFSLECRGGGVGHEVCKQPGGPFYFWVLMEAIVFYAYMASMVVFIAYQQLRNAILERPD